MKKRCEWVTSDPLYINYHDNEWGKPTHDDAVFYEFLLLESFQAGLSWLTILKKRENFRQAFNGFNYRKIANYDDLKIKALLNDKGIVRNKLKINAAINNANKFLEIQNEYGSFSNFIWSFTNNKVVMGNWDKTEDIPASTALSDKIFKALKNKGFKFLGTTTVYAFLQATGIVNDHINDCFCK